MGIEKDKMNGENKDVIMRNEDMEIYEQKQGGRRKLRLYKD